MSARKFVLSVFAMVIALSTSSVIVQAEINFEPFREFPTNEPSPWQIEAADMNGDGLIDLVVGGGFEIVSVMPGDGHGNFGSPIAIELDFPWFGFYGFTMADYDTDGDVDLAILRSYPNEVRVLINDGFGEFTQPNPTMIFPDDVLGLPLSFDFNGDQDFDVAVVVFNLPSFTFQVMVLDNDGTGLLTPNEPFEIGSDIITTALEAFDMEGDGDIDLIAGTDGNPDIQVLFNDGLGTFTLEMTYDVTNAQGGILALSVGLVNDDAYGDILAFTNTTSVVLGTDRCGPELVVVSDLDDLLSTDGVLNWGYVGTGDLDRNGTLEIVMVITDFGITESGIEVFTHDGDGVYDVSGIWWTNTDAGTRGANPLLVDLDGDGDADVVTLDEYRSLVGIWLNASEPGEVPNPPCYADANQDGTIDPLDAGFVLSQFGCDVCDGNAFCVAADTNRDLNVDPLDAGYVLARFGECPL